MSILKGRPDVPANTPLTAQLTYTRPYQQGTRLGIGTATLTYDWTDNRWEVGGEPFDMVAARWQQNDPAPSGEVRLLFKSGAGAGQQGGVLNILPVETAAGEVDITKPIVNVAWVAGAELLALIADATAAAQLAEDAAGTATTAASAANTARAATVAATNAANAAVANIGPAITAGAQAAATQAVAGVQAQVNTAIAGTTQAAALATAAAGITPRANLAAITGADGYYRAMDTGEVYQRAGGVNTRRPDLDALGPAQLGIVLARQDATLQASVNRAGPTFGREVYIGEGTFDIPALTLPDNVSIRGAGIGRTIITSSTAADIITMGLRCRLQDVTVRRGAANQRGIVDANPGSGVRANSLKRVRLEGFEAARGATFLRPNGLQLEGFEADACFIPLEINDPQGDVTITQPRITNAVAERMMFGILVKATTPNTVGKVRIINPYVRGANLDSTGFSAEAWGISVFNVLGVEITEPDIEECVSTMHGKRTGGGILFGSQSWGAKIRGGKTNRNRLGVFVEHQPEANSSIQQGRVLGSVVDGVTAAHNDSTGINVSYGPTGVVVNCIAHDNGEDGIFSDSDHNVIAGNTVYNNWRGATLPVQLKRAGIRVYGRYATIVNNKCHDNQANPTQEYGIAVNRRGHKITGNTGQGNITALVYQDASFDPNAIENITDLPVAGGGSTDVPLGSAIQQNNPGSAMYYAVATLPAGNSTQNKLVVETLGGDYNASAGLRAGRAVMSAFGGFAYTHQTAGPGNLDLAVVAYRQADNTVQVYVRTRAGGGGFTHGHARAYWQTGSGTAPTPLTLGAASATVPGGTLVLDTSNTATYPPNVELGVGKIMVGGNQVVGARQAAIANATDAASTQAQLNAVLAALRAHGLIAP